MSDHLPSLLHSCLHHFYPQLLHLFVFTFIFNWRTIALQSYILMGLFHLQPPSTKLLNSLSKLYSGNSAPLPSIHQLHLLVLVSLYKKYKVIITYPTYFSSLIPHPPVLLKLNFCSHPPNVHWTCPAFPGHYSKVSGIPVLLQGGVMMDKVNFLLP